MKQATFLICAFLVLFQVCSTVCDDTDTSPSAEPETVSFKVSDFDFTPVPLNDLAARWFSYSPDEDISTSDDIETVEIDDSELDPCHTLNEDSPAKLFDQCFIYFLAGQQKFPEISMN